MKKFLALLLACLLITPAALAVDLGALRDKFGSIHDQFDSQYADTDYYHELEKFAFDNYGKASQNLISLLKKGTIDDQEYIDGYMYCWLMGVEATNCINASIDAANSYATMLLDGEDDMGAMALSESMRKSWTVDASVQFFELGKLFTAICGDSMITESELIQMREAMTPYNELIAQSIDPSRMDELIEELETLQE